MSAKKNKSSEFHDYVVEDLLSGLPGITSRRMFSGYGIYKDGLFFALIAEGTLYFKVDSGNRADYEKLGSQPFRYSAKNRKMVTLSYWELPLEIMENREALEEWVERSLSAAQAAKK